MSLVFQRFARDNLKPVKEFFDILPPVGLD